VIERSTGKKATYAMNISRCIAAIVLTIALTASAAPAVSATLSPELRSLTTGPDIEVIVQYKTSPTQANHARVAALGGKLHSEMRNVKAAHYTVPRAQLRALAEDPDVTYISPNRAVKGMLNITGATVHSDAANTQGYTGSGIGVAVIDSGISDMPEFHGGAARIVYQQSFVPNVPRLNMGCPGGGAQVGAWYGGSLNLQGGIAPYSVSITSGSLSAGLALNPATGSITGIPLTSTSGPALVYSATVVDSRGNTATQNCNMNVNPALNGIPRQLQLNCPGGGAPAGGWYDALPNAQGGVPPYRFSISSGSLPGGLALTASTGEIAGIPATETYGPQIVFSITMKDTAGSSVTQNCNMNVGPAPPVPMTGTADQFGHGTHVAGIVGSSGNGSVYIGMAPAVNLINLRVLDQNGNGTDANVIQAIDTAISLARTYNIRVINLSLGRQVFESAAQDPLCRAAEAAWNAGIVVVAAAGNEGRNNSGGTQGYGTIAAPGNDPDVITVGAMKTEGTTTRNDDLIASYSSKGPTAFDNYAKPDLVAPGNLIVSTMPANMTLSEKYPANQVGSGFFILSGTSMATPVVSGAAVLLLQKTPGLTPDQVKARLMKNATKNFAASSVAVDPITRIAYTSYYDLFTIGAGYLDITAALADNTVASGSAQSPAVSYNRSTGKVTLQDIGVANVIWGTSVIWGTNVIWGTSVVSGSNVIWGTSVIWGTNVIWGTSVIWGTDTTDTSESMPLTIVGEQ
jgi:subtilisin family serine protease